MTSFRQIEANRRNAQLSTGPVTEEGKQRSKRNALRHGLTAETVIDGLEDTDDYPAFEMAIASEYSAETAVQRELVLRLASLLWRLRRATAIETGLFKIQARQLLQFRRRRKAHQDRHVIIEAMYRNAVSGGENVQLAQPESAGEPAPAPTEPADERDDLTHSYIRLCNLPTYPLDRLSRYEAMLWRQVCQTLFALKMMDRHKPWEQGRL